MICTAVCKLKSMFSTLSPILCLSFCAGSSLILPSSSSDLLADLLIALRGDEDLNAGLIHIVDVRPVSLDLGVFNSAGQAVDGPCCPGYHKCKL